jgi:hypothetical protein
LSIGDKQADAHADANELIIATASGNAGITINTESSVGGRIYFADGTSGADLYRGYLIYNHFTNSMSLGTNAATALVIDSAGAVSIPGAATIGSDTASGQVVKINGNGDSGDGAALAFQTVGTTKTQIGRQSGIIGGASSDNLALYAAAGLGVNVYTGGSNLRLSISSAGTVTVNTAADGLGLNFTGRNAGQDETWLRFYQSDGTTAQGGILGSNNVGLSLTGPSLSTVAAITDAGLAVTGTVTVSGGIQFPATQAASADANNLDDYEEGTWTPTLPNGGTLTVNYASYTRIGQQVTCNFYIGPVAPTADTSAFHIGGLPFTCSDVTNAYPAGTIGYVGDGDWSAVGLVGSVNTEIFKFHDLDGSNIAVTNNGAIAKWNGSVDEMLGQLTYIVK